MKWIAIASENNNGLDGQVSAHFGRCPFYVVVEVDGEHIVSHRMAPNPHNGQHAPGQMPRFIRSLGVNAILAGGMGPMAVNMFNGFGIDVATGASGPIREAVQAYLSGQLQGIVPCSHDHPESCGGHEQGSASEESSAPRPAPDTSLARVAVPATRDAGLASIMDPRFGRAAWFIIVDMASGQVADVLNNASATAAHGAGTGAAALMAQSGVDAVIAGRFGPKAHQALQALGIKLWTSSGELTVGQAVERLRAGELSRQV